MRYVLFMFIGASVLYAQDCNFVLEEPMNTGNNMTVGFSTETTLEGLIYDNPNAELMISAQYENAGGEFSTGGLTSVDGLNPYAVMAVWGDDYSTSTIDGFQAGELIQIFLHVSDGSCYQLVADQPLYYMANDIYMILDFALVPIEVSNYAPVAQDGTYTLDEDTSITLALEAYDVDGDALNYVIVDNPTNGMVTVSGNTAHYMPNVNFNGIDSFQFQVNDGQANSNIATAVLMVNAVNDAPYLYPIENASIMTGDIFNYNMQAEDVDGDILFYTATVSGGDAIVNIDGNALTIAPQESSATLNVVVTVTDGNTTHSVSFILTVFPQNATCFDNNNDGWCDHFPSLAFNEDAVLLFETEEGVEYIDSGAQCYDNEDGDISDSVTVSGQIVNMSVPNIYQIAYNCEDTDGNAAQTIVRTVVVIPQMIADENGDGFDDDGFIAGAQSGDINLDGTLNIVDIIIYINAILNND